MIVIRRNVDTNLQVVITFHNWFALRYLLSRGFWLKCASRARGYLNVNGYLEGKGSRMTESSVTDAGHNYTITVKPREIL